MEREDITIIIFLIILVIGIFYLIQNLSSFECSMEDMFSTKDVMTDISYEFEPEGSLYSKTKVFRFAIYSSKSKLEYFGMEVSNENGETLFFDNRTQKEGGSIVATLSLNETEKLTVRRFFKKECYPEVRL